MIEEAISAADVRRENRRLRVAIEVLLEELERSEPADHGRVREALGESPDRIKPPWERDGFGDKRAWLDERRGHEE